MPHPRKLSGVNCSLYFVQKIKIASASLRATLMLLVRYIRQINADYLYSDVASLIILFLFSLCIKTSNTALKSKVKNYA